MIAFVKEAEALMEKGQLERLRSEEGERSLPGRGQLCSDCCCVSSAPARITQLVRGFSSTWKQSVEAMSRDVMRSFTNFKNGTSIIQVRRVRVPPQWWSVLLAPGPRAQDPGPSTLTLVLGALEALTEGGSAHLQEGP